MLSDLAMWWFVFSRPKVVTDRWGMCFSGLNHVVWWGRRWAVGDGEEKSGLWKSLFVSRERKPERGGGLARTVLLSCVTLRAGRQLSSPPPPSTPPPTSPAALDLRISASPQQTSAGCRAHHIIHSAAMVTPRQAERD